MKPHLLILVVWALVGCEPSAPPPIAEPTLAWTTPSFTVGDMNRDGRLVFWSVNAFDHEEPFVLKDVDYGVILINDGTEEEPVAVYKLAIQTGSTGEILSTKDAAVFQAALRRIPKGAPIGVYETCSMPRAYGLTPQVRNEFKAMLKSCGHPLTECGVCYCPNR